MLASMNITKESSAKEAWQIFHSMQVYKRAGFNTNLLRKQPTQLIMELYRLSENWEYEELQEEMVGIRDITLPTPTTWIC